MCLLLNGQPQEEKANGTVIIPFGSDYELRFRNKHNRRACVQIFIDGENVSGGGYIIDAHSSIDIKRHSDVDRAFKFVSLDSADAIEQGKNGPNENKVKGTIEARFFLEKEKPVVPVANYHYHHYHYNDNPYPTPVKKYTWNSEQQPTYGYGQPIGFGGGSYCSNSPLRGTPEVVASFCNFAEQEQKTSGGITLPIEDGCTVEGESTGQKFFKINFEAETDYTSVKIFLQGYSTGEPGNARELFSVYCDRCGTKARKKAKFCAKCGHYL